MTYHTVTVLSTWTYCCLLRCLSRSVMSFVRTSSFSARGIRYLAARQISHRTILVNWIEVKQVPDTGRPLLKNNVFTPLIYFLWQIWNFLLIFTYFPHTHTLTTAYNSSLHKNTMDNPKKHNCTGNSFMFRMFCSSSHICISRYTNLFKTGNYLLLLIRDNYGVSAHEMNSSLLPEL